MSKLELIKTFDGKWFVSVDAIFGGAKTKKEAWKQAYIRLQKLADNAKNKYEGMK